MLDKIDNDIRDSLKSGDKARAESLKFLKSVLVNAKIAAGHDLSDEETFKIIRKEVKSRTEARDLYATGGRSELAAKEEYERNLYLGYVPLELSHSQIAEIVDKCAKEIKKELSFAQLMPAVMKQVAGRADGKTVSEIVNKYLKGE